MRETIIVCFLDVSGTIRIKGNQMFGLITDGKPFIIKFDLMILDVKVEEGWYNVLHISVGHNHAFIRDRGPTIYLDKNGNLILCTFRNNFPYKCTTLQHVNDVNKWYEFVIKQFTEGGRHKFEIRLNGVKEIVNLNPLKIKNVTVFIGNPWRPPQSGIIKNLYVNGKYHIT